MHSNPKCNGFDESGQDVGLTSIMTDATQATVRKILIVLVDKVDKIATDGALLHCRRNRNFKPMLIRPNSNIKPFVLGEHDGFEYLAVVQNGMQIGALALTPDGRYVQVNGDVVQPLNEEKTALLKSPTADFSGNANVENMSHRNFKLKVGSAFETVADPRFGNQVSGHRGLGLDLFAQVGHVHPHVVHILLVPRAPHGLEQLGVGDHAVGL